MVNLALLPICPLRRSRQRRSHRFPNPASDTLTLSSWLSMTIALNANSILNTTVSSRSLTSPTDMLLTMSGCPVATLHLLISRSICATRIGGTSFNSSRASIILILLSCLGFAGPHASLACWPKYFVRTSRLVGGLWFSLSVPVLDSSICSGARNRNFG